MWFWPPWHHVTCDILQKPASEQEEQDRHHLTTKEERQPLRTCHGWHDVTSVQMSINDVTDRWSALFEWSDVIDIKHAWVTVITIVLCSSLFFFSSPIHLTHPHHHQSHLYASLCLFFCVVWKNVVVVLFCWNFHSSTNNGKVSFLC